MKSCSVANVDEGFRTLLCVSAAFQGNIETTHKKDTAASKRAEGDVKKKNHLFSVMPYFFIR